MATEDELKQDVVAYKMMFDAATASISELNAQRKIAYQHRLLLGDRLADARLKLIIHRFRSKL